MPKGDSRVKGLGKWQREIIKALAKREGVWQYPDIFRSPRVEGDRMIEEMAWEDRLKAQRGPPHPYEGGIKLWRWQILFDDVDAAASTKLNHALDGLEKRALVRCRRTEGGRRSEVWLSERGRDVARELLASE